VTGRRIRGAAMAAVLAGGALVGGDGWLAAKGALARVLIARATAAAVNDGGIHRPWPWADFHPVARIEVPRLGVVRPVLSGATGAVLAFGLGRVDGTADPGSAGLSVVGGHRDGDARFLGRLAVGDRLRVVTASGPSDWRVARTAVVRPDDARFDPGGGDRLWLVTCWPIEATLPGELRYVVEAVPGDPLPAALAEGYHRDP